MHGSSLSVGGEWPSDLPKLTRAVSTISLSSNWSVTSKFRGFGFTKTVKQKSKHGFGGTKVLKVKTMQGIGMVHSVKRGLNNDVVTQEINRRVEEMKLSYRQSRPEIQRTTVLPSVEPVFRKSMSDPSAGSSPGQGTTRKDSVGTMFKHPKFWSDFLRGVYPNSLPIDKLADKDEISPDKYDTTVPKNQSDVFRDSELSEHIQSSNIASGRVEPYDMNTGSDLKDNKETGGISVDLLSSDNDLSDTSHQEDVWGPLRIPESKDDMFKTGRGDEGLYGSEHKANSHPKNQPNNYTSDIQDELALRNENTDVSYQFDGDKLPEKGHPFLTKSESLTEKSSDVGDFRSEEALPASSKFTERDGYISDIESEVNSGNDSKIEHDSDDEIRDKNTLHFDRDVSVKGSVGSDDEHGDKTKFESNTEDSCRESCNSNDEPKVRGRSYSVEVFVTGKGHLENAERNWSLKVNDFRNVGDEHEEVHKANLLRFLGDLSKTRDVLLPYGGASPQVSASMDAPDSDSERSLESIQDGGIFEPISTSERVRPLSDHQDMYASVHDLTAL